MYLRDDFPLTEEKLSKGNWFSYQRICLFNSHHELIRGRCGHEREIQYYTIIEEGLLNN